MISNAIVSNKKFVDSCIIQVRNSTWVQLFKLLLDKKAYNNNTRNISKIWRQNNIPTEQHMYYSAYGCKDVDHNRVDSMIIGTFVITKSEGGFF